MQIAWRFTVLALTGFLSASSWAGQLPSRFTLGRYVPGDVWLYLHEVDSPERAWIENRWTDVFDALAVSGLDRDITALALSLIQSEEDRTAAEATIDKWTQLLKNVKWSQLCSKEFVYAQRVAKTPGSYDYFVMSRSDVGSAKDNAAALASILREVAELHETVQLTEREVKGGKAWSLTFGTFAISIELLHRGDVIALTTGRAAMDEVTALMAGKSQKGSLVKSKRFVSALTEAKSPEYFVSFLDTKTLFSDLKGVMKSVAGQLDPDDDAERAKALGTITKLFDLCDVVDYVVETRETDGRREFHHTVARIQSEKRKCKLACCFLDRKPFKKFDRFIPAEATGFSVSTSVDIEGLYDFALEVVQNDVPGGADLIAKWNGILETVGFDPKRDLFSWWSGEIISVTMPPAVVTPMGGADKVMMLRVKDAKIAQEKIAGALNFVNSLAQGQGQGLMVSPADVRAEGFQQVTYPMLAMFVRPVIGVAGDWLIVGTSSAAINKCLDVAEGKAPSIRTNERFKKEGLLPKGPVLAASFTDTSKFGQELGKMVGVFGMVSGIGSSMMSPGPQTDKIKKVIQKVSTMVMKLGPVLQKLDFYSSESSTITLDGDSLVRIETVVMYKAPSADEVKTAAAK